MSATASVNTTANGGTATAALANDDDDDLSVGSLTIAETKTSPSKGSPGKEKVEDIKEETAKEKRRRLRAQKKQEREQKRIEMAAKAAALMTPEEVAYKKKADREKLKKNLSMPIRDSYFRDLRFKILDAYKATYPKLLAKHPKPMYIAVNFKWLVSQVVTRIAAMLKISTRRVRLVFCGRTLDSDEYIPEDAFESLEKLLEDEDFFRPRIFVALKNDKTEDEKSSEEDEEDDDDDTEEEDEVKNNDDDENAELGASGFDNMAELELHVAGSANATLIPSKDHTDLAGIMAGIKFDLRSELKQIECEQYYDTIGNAGYVDMGSFSHLDEDRLTRPDCYVAKRSRIRIIALADALRRKIAVMDKDVYTSAKDKIDRDNAMRNSKLVRGLGDEAGGALFTNKAAMNRAWAKKAKEDEIKRLAEVERLKRIGMLPDPKPHPKELQEKIDHVKKILFRDEFDYPVNVMLPPPHVDFCCEKHRDLSVLTRKQYFHAKRQQNETESKALFIRIIEETKVEVISRDILNVIANYLIKKNGHITDPFEINQLLDQCIMEGDIQVERMLWKDEIERRENGGKIPVCNYDVIQFMYKLIEYIDVKNQLAYT